jgi:hypothetical protein
MIPVDMTGHAHVVDDLASRLYSFWLLAIQSRATNDSRVDAA